MKLIAENRTPLFLLLLLLFLNSFSVDLNNPYKKPINGDAKGYYAYLPALVIYKDLDYTFIPAIEKKYYVEANAKSFVKEIDGEKVNKTFPGVAFLYLPFFLMAHGISLLFGLPADGYAYTYQLLYLVGFWTYFFFGMIYFKKVLLELNFTKKIADLSLIICVLGTNIVFYTVYDSSVTHIYNFFLVNVVIYLLLQLRKEFQAKKLILFFALLAIIGITRPTNFLVFGLIVFFIPDLAFYKDLFSYLFRRVNAFKTLLLALFILFIPLILWKLQTGKWIVYSYGEEGFNFSQPEIINFLFSYTKGWFLYTPIALLILIPGLILLFKSDKKRAIISTVFYIISIYIFSSWWCWYYGAGMSQRVMIEYTILLGFLLALILTKINSKRYLNLTFLSVVVLLIGLNIAQAYQVGKGILTFGSPTKEQYWDNFLSFQKQAKIYPQESWKLIEEQKISLNPADGFIEKGNSHFTNEEWIIKVSEINEYSAVIQLDSTVIDEGNKLIFSFEARANTPIELTRLVITIGDFSPVFFLKEYVRDGEWVKMEFLVEPHSLSHQPIDLFFWNAGSGESVDIRSLGYKNYFTEEYF